MVVIKWLLFFSIVAFMIVTPALSYFLKREYKELDDGGSLISYRMVRPSCYSGFGKKLAYFNLCNLVFIVAVFCFLLWVD